MRYHKIELLLGDERGQYIPRDFAVECWPAGWMGCPQESIDTLAKGPVGGVFSTDDASEDYWEIWNSVLDDAYFVAEDSDTLLSGRWTLVQDGSLFAIHETYNPDEEE